MTRCDANSKDTLKKMIWVDLEGNLQSARIHKDITIKSRGILLKLVKCIIFPIIGGSISGKYNAMVSPMNPMAMMCIARS